MTAAFATLILVLFATDEDWTKLFFGENWKELEDSGSLGAGFLFPVIGCIWTIPILCFIVTLGIVLFRKLAGYN